MKPIKYLLIALLFNTVCSLESQAADKVASGCDPASIQQALNSAVSGDTVWFPSGSCNATWTTGVSMSTSGVTLMGRTTGCPSACVDNTVITDQTSGGAVVVHANTVRVSGITFTGREDAGGQAGSIWVYYDNDWHDWRFDHNHFKDSGQTYGGTRSIMIGVGGDGHGPHHYSGVIDHNYFTAIKSNSAICVWGDSATAWSRPSYLGNSNSDSVFVEDNTAVFSSLSDGLAFTECSDGGRLVVRYNNVTNAMSDVHGSGDYNPLSRASCVTWEYYNNTFTNTSIPYWTALFPRGGTGVIFNNAFNSSGSGSWTNPIRLQSYRGDVPGYCDQSTGCSGSYSTDLNQAGLSGYVCYQQPGASGTSGITSAPIYEWSNTWNGNQCNSSSKVCMTATDDCGLHHVQVNRDYFLNGTTPKPGYTPYTYPHPLITGSTVTAKPKAPYLHP